MENILISSFSSDKIPSNIIKVWKYKYNTFKIDKNGLSSSEEKNNGLNEFDKNEKISTEIPNIEITGTLINLFQHD